MKWFNDLRVAVKIFFCCLIFLVLIGIVSFQGIYSMRMANDQFNVFYTDRFIPVRDFGTIMRNILQIRVNMITQYMAAGRKDFNELNRRRNDSVKLTKGYSDLWEVYKNMQHSQEEMEKIKAWEKNRDIAKEHRVVFDKALDRGDMAAAQNGMDQWLKYYREIRNTTDELIQMQVVEADKIKAEQDRRAQMTFYFSVFLLAVAVGLGIIITIVLSRSVKNPVQKGLLFAKAFAEGDMTARVELEQKDELGQLAVALNGSADKLEELISSVSLAAQNLAQAVDQIASGNQNLSQRTSEQASSLEEIASTIEEANAAIKQNADNSSEANKLSENSFTMAEEGGTLSDDAVKAINDISEVSRKINDITGVINEIAFQTNLLALNAAVEAARAGEAGRGFAVVAGEIRNLAQRSGSAAKEIEELIQNTVEKIGFGSEMVNRSGSSLREIIQAIKQVSTIVSEIAAASLEQKQGMEQITTAITEMDNMTQQNAALVEETASASEEMSNQAQEMLAMTKRFKVGSMGYAEGVKRDTKIKSLHAMLEKQETQKPTVKVKAQPQLHKEKEEEPEKRVAPAIAEAEKRKADQKGAMPELQEKNLRDVMNEEGFEEF